jgi:cyclopropane fatty-acyl-phospholipid synthase-like methyltransferase
MRLKSVASSVLRKLHLLNLAEQLRFLLHKLKFNSKNIAFKKENPAIVFPPDFLIYETYKLNLSEYYYDGKQTATEIITTVGKNFSIKPGSKILDWGCGPGRIVRHLPELLPQASVYATDYNDVYVKWCIENLENIQVSLNNIDPPLNYKNSFFDVVIAISIFTHLTEQNHFAWIDELKRIIKPGGIAFITTQGESYRSKLLSTERLKFDNGKLVTREEIKEGNRLFSAFQPPVFFQQLTENHFDLVEFISSGKDINPPVQDIWVLRRKM